MSQSIVRHQTPEEREYARYLADIEVRKRRVAELQADLATYKDALGRFNAEYHARVGVLFVELDQVELAIKEYEYRIAQLRAHPTINPETLERETKQQFSEEREQIHEDEEETRYYEREHQQEQQRPELDAESERSLKALYRDLAKRFHPDLARSEDERAQREAVMKEVNAAFHERDFDRLRRVAARHDIDDAAFEEKSIGEKLVWAIREVSRLDDLIDAIQQERAGLETSELAQLWDRQRRGEDVLHVLELDIRAKIHRATVRLQTVTLALRRLAEKDHLV